MNEDLQKFENRSDDWLAKERKHEETVSAWDFDEGKRIKQAHEEHCEATYIKEAHEKAHQDYEEHQHKKQTSSSNQFKRMDGSTVGTIIAIIIAVIVLETIFIGAFDGENVMAILPISIIAVVGISSIKSKRRK